MLRAAVLTALLLLAACAGPSVHTGPNLAAAQHYSGLTCAPFARSLTGIELHGDAADWWGEAPGRYQRSARPAVGAVLVFRRGRRLPSGHVSVVSRVLDARRILVVQANWEHDELDEDQLVVDVSARNDWTAVRVWYAPTGKIGTHIYATDGFILAPAPLGHDTLLAHAPLAARAVTGG